MIIQVVIQGEGTQREGAKNYTQTIQALFRILKIFNLRGSGSSNLGFCDWRAEAPLEEVPLELADLPVWLMAY